MEFQRILLTLLLFFLSNFIHALPKLDNNQGIAFIHGTQDHKKDAEGGYWKRDFIARVSDSLAKPENHFVVHCDYSRYMWSDEAAQCTADQLNEFILDNNISSLTIYAHSNGANIIRWILSNPTYNSSYMSLKQKIRQVIAIAPSSGGTVLADEVLSGGIFENSLGWLLGYLCDAIKQQRVGDMLLYNQELLLGSKNRASLAVPFKVIVGTDVAASPLSRASYCNGYLLNSGLKLAKLYLNKCADGLLNCNSQKAAGTVWFYDLDKTDDNNTLSHNQSRHSCFGLEHILASTLTAEGVA